MKQSLFRKLTNKELSGISINGNVLDIGGSNNSGYHKLFDGEYSITTLNLHSADIIFDLEQTPIPVKDESYEAVLAINLLEHIYNYQGVLEESRRVLKSGGEFIAVIPFLYYIHPSPHDFVRLTKESLERLLSECEFSDISIKPIGYGAFSTAYNLIHRFLPSPLHVVFEKISILSDTSAKKLAKTLDKKYTGDEYALGYLIRARKV